MIDAGNSEIFDFDSDEAFFRFLRRTASKLQSQKVKTTSGLLYLIMGLNHLRDWIAPGFDWKNNKPETDEQKFYVEIYENCADFQILNNICNRSKHMAKSKYKLETRYGAKLSEWPNISSIARISNGPPTGYVVDGRDILNITNSVLNYYETNWYQHKLRSR